MRTSFGNALARMGRAMVTQPRFNPNHNIFRGCYMQLRQASAAGKNPETNLTRGTSAALLPTPTSKSKLRTNNSNKSPIKAAHPRIIPSIAKKVDLVVRPSISSRSDPRSTKERCQSGFHNTVLDDLVWPRDSQIIRLPLGAQLSYARLGRLKEVGQCWVIFHGTPGSRLEVATIHGYAETHGVRIIAIDRPGYGHSTLHGRGILGFMQDVEHLFDYHGIQEFKVYGVSGGGPYALGATFHFPKSRLSKTSIMCGCNHPDFASTGLSLRTRLTLWLRGRASFLYSSGGNFNYFLHRDVVSAKGNETKILRARLN